MDNNSKLVDLVQQAASTVNMVSPQDLSDLEQLQTVFGEITSQIKEFEQLSDQLQGQAADATSSASNVIAELLATEADDAEKSLKTIADTVVALQAMMDAVEKDPNVESLDVPFPSGQVQVETPQAVEAEVVEEAAPEAQADTESVIIPEDDVPLVADFITEANEHIEAGEAGLLVIEENPSDAEAINTVFRGFHTVKGMAGFLNLAEIGSLAHSAETLLDMGRKGDLQLVDSNMDVVFESVDMLKKMIADLQVAIENTTPISSQATLPILLTKLEACANGEPVETDAAVPEAKEEPQAEEAQAVEAQPAPEAEVAPQPEPQATEEAATETAQPEQKVESAPVEQAPQPEAAPQAEAAPAKQQATTKAKQVSEEKIKVSTTRLDSLVNMAGELVIAQSMVSQNALQELGDSHYLCNKISQQGKIVRELQELAMLMRMVPIQGVFGKMARLARDLSRKSGKKVNFITQGEETELDRNVVDHIADPLIHMVRNSMDHGLEATAEDRVAAGKTAEGNVWLRAFHQAGNVVIEIEDDGRGLNKDKIIQKAIDNGIMQPGSDMSDSEIYKLIFHAGFSTAEKITAISGRGVGMDVVKKNIESLRGKIEIESAVGKGTKFTIRLPLTLAIIDGQVIRIGHESYILPIISIERCIRPNASQLSTLQGRGEMVLVQGELLPVVRLYNLFNVKADSEELTASSLVVVEEDGKKGALVVDELLDQQQIVIKSLGETFGDIKGVSGGAIMGNGRVSLILDIPGLLEIAYE